MTRILCVWLPNWPIQRLVHARPELQGQPIVLVAEGPRGGWVAACSRTAAAQGVRPAMPVAEAKSLVPAVVLVPHEPPRDRQALEQLAEACEQFSPCVGLEEGGEPTCLLLDISNLEHLWGSEAVLVEQVKQFFTRGGYRARLAVGETIGAAWALAHCGEEDCKLTMRGRPTNPPTKPPEEPGAALSRADDSPQPPALKERRGARSEERGVRTRGKGEGGGRKEKVGRRVRFPLPPSALRFPPLLGSRLSTLDSRLAPLPIEALRITGDTATLLRQLGIETIEQLLSLPREGLAPRFGEELLQRLDQLIGAVPEVIEPHRPSAPLAASQALEEPTTDCGQLTHILRELVERLSRRLAARDQGAVLVMCSLRSADGRTQPLRIGLLEPSASARQLMELIGLHLEAVRLTAEVDRVDIRVAVTGRLGQRQGELFADRWPSDAHQIALLINRLSSRLCCEQVLRAELRASPVPERGVKWIAAVERKDKETRRRGDKERRYGSHSPRLLVSLSPCLSPKPLLLHPKPQRIEVVCVAPDGPPQFVWLGGRRERVTQHVGPERIETLWWRGPAVRRDYYRVAVESGSHLWLFRRLADGCWFLHGMFE